MKQKVILTLEAFVVIPTPFIQVKDQGHFKIWELLNFQNFRCIKWYGKE